jgi:hypothetical protein
VTIEKGQPWGVAVDRPDDLLVVDSDAALALALVDRPGRPVGPSAGDLHRSLGSPPARREMQRLPVDLLVCRFDERTTFAIAHVVMRSGWWRGPVVAAMNVDHLGSWNVAPRAHPNDGRVDVVEVAASMNVRARWQARCRLPAGGHVPHPAIAVSTTRERSWQFDRDMTVWVDGVRAGTARTVSIEVLPDAGEVLI